jgi:hypothetical protein
MMASSHPIHTERRILRQPRAHMPTPGAACLRAMVERIRAEANAAQAAVA